LLNIIKNEKFNYIIRVALFLSAATGFGYLFRYAGFSETTVVIIYLLAVFCSACMTRGYLYGLVSAVLATFAYNFFFTEPVYSFAVNDAGYLITFVVMTVISVISSTLASKLKRNAEKAEEKETEAKALYKLTGNLTDADGIDEIASKAVKIVSEVMGTDVSIISFTEPYVFVAEFNGKEIHRKADNIEEIILKASSAPSGVNFEGEFRELTLYGQKKPLGLIRILSAAAEQFTETQNNLLHSMMESISLAIDRFIANQEKIKSDEEAVREHYKNNLLRAISHDIRTPLSGILGMSEIMMDTSEKGSKIYELAHEIYSDADWLHSMVENILSLTRLRDGNIPIVKGKEAIEEIIGSAVADIKKLYQESSIKVKVPEEVLLVPMDAMLIRQVVLNILDNAVKHCGENVKIEINVSSKESFADVSIKDNGNGIKKGEEDKIFNLFYTGEKKTSDGKKGVGLGLAICKTIIEAHGGKIFAKNRTDGNGAEFTFTLPL